MIQKVKAEHNVLPRIYSAMETIEVLHVTYKIDIDKLNTVVGTVQYIDFSKRVIRVIIAVK